MTARQPLRRPLRLASGRDRERGAALLIALGGLALIAALAAGALSLTAGPATRASAAVAEAEARRAAEAAIHRLAAAMARRDLRGAAPLDGAVVSTRFFGARLDVSGQDVAGLVDLNAADEATLTRLLIATGAATDEAQSLAAIWRAEREAGRDGGAAARRRGGFRSVEDAVAAAPPALAGAARAAAAHATVWSGVPTVDPYVATAPALAAAADLPLDVARAFVAARLVEGRRAALPGDADLNALAISDVAAARLSVRATTEAGGRAAITVTIRATSSPRAPIRFLEWR